MTARIIPLRPRAASELTEAEMVTRARDIEHDITRAENAAASMHIYVEHAIKSIATATAGTPEMRAQAITSLRDGLALMSLGLAHVIEIDAKGGAR